MAALNLTTTDTRAIRGAVDRLTTSLCSTSPDELAQLLDSKHGRFSLAEAECIQFAHRAVQIGTNNEEATEALMIEWEAATARIMAAMDDAQGARSVRALELFQMADACIESAYTAH